MNEGTWVQSIAEGLAGRLRNRDQRLKIEVEHKLAYGYEIVKYGVDNGSKLLTFKTDLAVLENLSDGTCVPRVVVEAKVKSVNTHDAITYSQKALSHRSVHPYLRYGMMLGMRGHYPLPGRLYRHGVQFDFMISFRTSIPTESEWRQFVDLLLLEVKASRDLECILYESRMKGRDHYTILHRKLELR